MNLDYVKHMKNLSPSPAKKDYLSKYLCNAPVALALIRAIECKLMDSLPFANPMLDLGCGDGLFSSILFKDKNTIECAMDISESEVELCYKKSVYQQVKVADAEDIPYHDESFKFVLANDILAHVKRPEVALNEAWRVLQKNGLLCFTVPTIVPDFHFNVFSDFLNNISPLNILKLFNHNIKSYFRLNSIMKFQQWTKLLKECGFRIVYHKKYASLSAISVQIITSFYLYRGSIYKKALGRYIPFPEIQEKIVMPITSWLLKSLYADDSYEGENYLILAKKIEE